MKTCSEHFLKFCISLTRVLRYKDSNNVWFNVTQIVPAHQKQNKKQFFFALENVRIELEHRLSLDIRRDYVTLYSICSRSLRTIFSPIRIIVVAVESVDELVLKLLYNINFV